MLTSTLALATLAFSGSVLASIGYNKETGGLSAIDTSSKHELDSEIEYKEVCYRNLYADLEYFKVHNSKELLTSDTKGAQVFLSEGLKKAYDDVEYYYEEFCYKQYKERSHENNVDKAHGITVGKRDFASSLGLGDLSGFSTGAGPGAKSGGDELGGASGLFSKGSFLDTFSKGDGMGDFGLDFKDDSHDDQGKKDDSSTADNKNDDGVKGDAQQQQHDNGGDKGGLGGSSFGSSLPGGGSFGSGSFGSGPGSGDDKYPVVGDGKAYGDDGKDASHTDGVKVDGVKKRGFVLLSRRFTSSRH
ncbi:hypothetical protein JCM8208_000379 [Rhodotorula glutinis]